MAFGSMSMPDPNLARASQLLSAGAGGGATMAPGAPADSSVGGMGMRILQAAIAARGKAGAPPSMLPQIMPQAGGAAPVAPGAAPAAPGGAPMGGMLKDLLESLGIGGGGMGNRQSLFQKNAMMEMRDPNATWNGGPVAQPAPGVPLPPPQPPVVNAGPPAGPGPTAMSGIW